ncbi:MAG: glycine betaine ABC transporter substrate-binding protein [Bacillota bacterium]|nr:glycine betaine ABC transporter substrate-binding protein [Bacillota bacterium]
MMKIKIPIVIIVVISLLISFSGCGEDDEEVVDSQEIRICTKNTEEQEILARLASILITERTDHEVTIVKEDNVTSKSLYEDLKAGKIDLYFDYAGSIFLNALEKPAEEMEYAVVLVQLQTAMLEEGIYVSDSIGYDGGMTLYITPELRDELGLDKSSGISSLEKLSPDLVIGMEESFYQRDKGYKALCDHYDLKFQEAKVYSEEEGFYALRRGDIDIMVGSRTSVYNNMYNLYLFKDDKRFFTPETACYVGNDEFLLAYPEVKTVMDTFNGLLTSGTVSIMIRNIYLEGRDMDTYLRDFLRARNLL